MEEHQELDLDQDLCHLPYLLRQYPQHSSTSLQTSHADHDKSLLAVLCMQVNPQHLQAGLQCIRIPVSPTMLYATLEMLIHGTFLLITTGFPPPTCGDVHELCIIPHEVLKHLSGILNEEGSVIIYTFL
jgi:hypothetical protein